jgi:asparagine synthase (glutamine-hydrolysing)
VCGISGVVDPSSGAASVEPLMAMHARIPHRGPDGEGFCLLDHAFTLRDAEGSAGLRGLAEQSGARVALAFRWLQIQDRSPGSAQPMASADGKLRLVFNGEIYNFRALREELAAGGHRFGTASDTEVILAAYRAWGTGMFERLDGMWALALLDAAARKLVLSRDRFGIKPLYYSYCGGRLLFASEAKQLLAAGVSSEANRDAVARFIPGARPAGTEQTFFANIHAHPAASYCELDLQSNPGELRFLPYWALARTQAALSYAEAQDRLDRVLQSSVRMHMAAQVPVGVLASGGLDSGIVAALSVSAFADRAQEPVAFSMVLGPGEPQDESPAIAQLRDALGFEGFTTTLDAARLRSRIDEIALAQEEPIAGMAVGGQYATLALAARHGIRVVLDGQGSDEIFAGYPRHQYALIAAGLRRGSWPRTLAEAGAILWRDASMFRRPSGVPAAGVRTLTRQVPSPIASPRLSLGETLRNDVLHGNLRWVLGVTDRNAMAHSIEARVPYVSRDVVELAFSLPDQFKVGAGWRKRILRDVALRHLPAPIVRRKARVGFGVPALPWLRREFAADLLAVATGPAAAGTLFDADQVGRFVEGFLSGAHDDAGTAWRLYAVDRWVRAYSVTGL